MGFLTDGGSSAIGGSLSANDNNVMNYLQVIEAGSIVGDFTVDYDVATGPSSDVVAQFGQWNNLDATVGGNFSMTGDYAGGSSPAVYVNEDGSVDGVR